MSAFDDLINSLSEMIFGRPQPPARSTPSSGRTAVLTPASRPAPAARTTPAPAHRPARQQFDRVFSGLGIYEFTNSEGEYVTIDTNNDKNFKGPTWDLVISSFVNRIAVKGTVTMVKYAKSDARKIVGFDVVMKAENSNHVVKGFLPARYANLDMQVNDVVFCQIKEFDPLPNKRKYNLILKYR